MKGRKKTPAKILQLRKSRWATDNEPKVELGIPAAPDFLSKIARKYWDQLVNDIHQAGILAQIDGGIFAGYCTALANLEIAEKGIQKDGYIQSTEHAGDKKTPWVLIAKEARDQIRSLGSELGMTPASRARLKATPAEDKTQGARKFLA